VSEPRSVSLASITTHFNAATPGASASLAALRHAAGMRCPEMACIFAVRDAVVHRLMHEQQNQMGALISLRPSLACHWFDHKSVVQAAFEHQRAQRSREAHPCAQKSLASALDAPLAHMDLGTS
jgi:hypothetical protein